MFESHYGMPWRVIGAYNFAPIEEHSIGCLQQWACQADDAEAVLQKLYATVRDAAESQGAASIWLLYNPDKKVIGLQLGFRKDGSCDPESARRSLARIAKLPPIEQHLPEALGLKPLFDRTSILLTLWLPRSRAIGGSELTIPFYPMVPDITHHHH